MKKHNMTTIFKEILNKTIRGYFAFPKVKRFDLGSENQPLSLTDFTVHSCTVKTLI